jgi:2-keto-myo-inositol isomerase
MLEDHGLVGMVEPLGFEICALRYKAEAVDAIEAVGGKGRFKLVHDTFHHTLAHGGPIFPDHTGIVHISGVVDQAVSVAEMRDPHRVLVTGADRLDNIGQIAALMNAGWSGPCSFEAFSPEVHALAEPAGALRASMDLIKRGIA